MLVPFTTRLGVTESLPVEGIDVVRDFEKFFLAEAAGCLFADEEDIVNLLPHLVRAYAKLSKSVVLDIHVREGEAEGLLNLMGLTGIYFLFSVGPDQAHDFLVAADLLASLSSTPVLVVHLRSAAFEKPSRYAADLPWEEIRAGGDISDVFATINQIQGTSYVSVAWVGQQSKAQVVKVGLNLNIGVKDVSVSLYSPEFAANLVEHVTQAEVVEVLEASVGFHHVVLDAIYQLALRPEVRQSKPPLKQQVEQIDLESIPYVQLLRQVFNDRLILANQLASPSISQVSFGYGAILAHIHTRQAFLARLRRFTPPQQLRPQLTQYLLHPNDDRHAKALENLFKLHGIKEDLGLLYRPSYWVVGGDLWWRDIADSGFHQVLQSGEDINLLILDTHSTAKKDLGLYAMSYQSAYVASCAIYASYAHAARSLLEAHHFKATSVVLAYLPVSAQDSLMDVRLIKDSKVAVDTGKWPLYRWDPRLDKLTIDSTAIREDLAKFLKREEQVYELTSKFPELEPPSHDARLQKSILNLKANLSDAVTRLLNGLNKNITILYGSDGGNGDRVAKLLEKSAMARNFTVKRLSANDISHQDLLASKLAVFIVSTAGQGEFPMNARKFWKRLQNFPKLEGVQFGVFGLGDSHYWPNAGDEAYFNQAARDLHAKLVEKGAQPLLEVGLGDDQAQEGYMAAFREWEPKLWQGLGNNQEVTVVEEPKVSDDQMKLASNFLRGTIQKNLDDRTTGSLPESDTKLTKFHGIYQQDDRDLREERIERGLEPKYSFMVRVRVPGGVASPHQWLAMDEISHQLANCTIKLTTRQAFQFHGILKWNLRPTLQAINKVAMDTLAACGDVNRNVMVSCHASPIVHAQVSEFARDLSKHLSPQTSAYAEIWLDKVLVGGPVVVDHEPLYGPTYLPRKFKIAIAIPPTNDVDVHAHCLGFVAILDGNRVTGYTVTVGGGMGMSHNNTATFPRLADDLGFCTPDQAIAVAEAVLLVQRDFGDRTNRKHARLKYTIQDRGLPWFRNQVESRLGFKLLPPVPYIFTSNTDPFGWHQRTDGLWNCGLYLQNGRLADMQIGTWRTGLNEVARYMQTNGGSLTLTPNQNLILSAIPSHRKQGLQALLQNHQLPSDPKKFSRLRLSSMACVALPTCSLAMAEAERYLPKLITKIEQILLDLQLDQTDISLRMTGCPNGCARPYVSEIALVGKAPGTYNLLLGGDLKGTRLNLLYKESLTEHEILQELTPLLTTYKLNRTHAEPFGNFLYRTGIIKLPPPRPSPMPGFESTPSIPAK